MASRSYDVTSGDSSRQKLSPSILPTWNLRGRPPSPSHPIFFANHSPSPTALKGIYTWLTVTGHIPLVRLGAPCSLLLHAPCCCFNALHDCPLVVSACVAPLRATCTNSRLRDCVVRIRYDISKLVSTAGPARNVLEGGLVVLLCKKAAGTWPSLLSISCPWSF